MPLFHRQLQFAENWSLSKSCTGRIFIVATTLVSTIRVTPSLYKATTDKFDSSLQIKRKPKETDMKAILLLMITSISIVAAADPLPASFINREGLSHVLASSRTMQKIETELKKKSPKTLDLLKAEIVGIDFPDEQFPATKKYYQLTFSDGDRSIECTVTVTTSKVPSGKIQVELPKTEVPECIQ